MNKPLNMMDADDVRARRDLLEANMRAEGTPEHMIRRLATDDTAAKMLDYEAGTLAFIKNIFGAP